MPEMQEQFPAAQKGNLVQLLTSDSERPVDKIIDERPDTIFNFFGFRQFNRGLLCHS